MDIEKKGPFGPDTLVFKSEATISNRSVGKSSNSATFSNTCWWWCNEGCGSSDGNKAWRYTTGTLGLFLVMCINYIIINYMQLMYIVIFTYLIAIMLQYHCSSIIFRIQSLWNDEKYMQ